MQCDSPGLPAAKKSKTQAEDSGNSKVMHRMMCGEKNSNRISELQMGIEPTTFQTLVGVTEVLTTLVMSRLFVGGNNELIVQSH